MIKLEELVDIFRLKETGYSISSISRITGKDRKTIRKYLHSRKLEKPEIKHREEFKMAQQNKKKQDHTLPFGKFQATNPKLQIISKIQLSND